ncbi:FAD-binding protein [Scytonema sp. PCC 10023]|uniref:FAD-binding protein n=1 Tax=Scytonema sp. PCC 10023 TaxID=1680591 RepID=UPI0039C5C4D3
MNQNTSRRQVLQGLVASAIVIGFDVSKRSWVTSASATSIFESLPPLDGKLYTDNETLASASLDFGNIVHRQPTAVLQPESIEDIVEIVQFARTHQIKVAARRQGHSTYGQPQVEAGIVIDMSTLNKIHFVGTDRAVVDAGVLWSQLLQQTLQQGLTPPVLTDYIELSIGGTLSVGGIGGTTPRYGVQVDNVLEVNYPTPILTGTVWASDFIDRCPLPLRAGGLTQPPSAITGFPPPLFCNILNPSFLMFNAALPSRSW